MKAEDSCYTAEIPIDEIGTYSMYMQVVGNGIEKKTEDNPIVVNVGNSVPVVNKDKIEQHFWVIPFITDTGDIDISGAVTDAEDSKLSYSVESSSFKDTSYKLDGETLTMTDFYDLSEGSFTIKAIDSNGASAEFEVDVTTTNVGIVTLIVVGSIILILLILAFLKLRHDLLLKFSGTITVTPEGNASGSATSLNPIRERCKLSSFGVALPGLDISKCYFQATGKNYIVFVSKKKFYISGLSSPVKNIKIQGNGSETAIMSSPNSEDMLYLSFESMLNVF